MITKIFEDGKSKITAWTDTPESLVKATHGAIFGKQEVCELKGESGTIKNVRGDWFTKEIEVAQAALEMGYWCEKNQDWGTEIHFTWSQKADNPPNRRAYHK